MKNILYIINIPVGLSMCLTGTFRFFALLLLPLCVQAANAEQSWQATSYQERVFSAVLRNEKPNRIIVECRVGLLYRPEVTVTLVIESGPKIEPKSEVITTLKIGSESFRILMTRLDNAYRWTVIGPLDLATLNQIVEAMRSGRMIAVREERPGLAEEFLYDPISSNSVENVVRRCNPASVHARREAQELTSIPSLLALEASANRKCRGGTGDNASTFSACDERTEYVERLNTLRMCYGEKGQYGAQMRWHRCGPNSNR